MGAQAVLTEHERVVDATERRGPVMARNAMTQHLQDNEQAVKDACRGKSAEAASCNSDGTMHLPAGSKMSAGAGSV